MATIIDFVKGGTMLRNHAQWEIGGKKICLACCVCVLELYGFE